MLLACVADWLTVAHRRRGGRLHFLFPATMMGPLGCKSLLSALLNNFEPILLNFGSQETGSAARLLKVGLSYS